MILSRTKNVPRAIVLVRAQLEKVSPPQEIAPHGR